MVKKIIRVLPVLILIAFSQIAVAAPRSWTGAGGAGNDFFRNPGKWSPLGKPLTTDDIVIGDVPPDVSVSVIDSETDTAPLIKSLTMLNDAKLSSNLCDPQLQLPDCAAKTFTVSGSTKLTDDSILTILTQFFTEELKIFELSDVILGGYLEVDNTVEIEQRATLTFDNGFSFFVGRYIDKGQFVKLDRSSGIVLINDGTIRVLAEGDGTISSDGGMIDLDGVTEGGRVFVAGAGLSLVGSLADDFDSVLRIDAPNATEPTRFSISEPWTAGSDAHISLDTPGQIEGGKLTSSARISISGSSTGGLITADFDMVGGSLGMGGGVPLEATRELELAGATTISGDANLDLHSDSTLRFTSNTPTAFGRATIRGSGEFVLDNLATLLDDAELVINHVQGTFLGGLTVGTNGSGLLSVTRGASVIIGNPDEGEEQVESLFIADDTNADGRVEVSGVSEHSGESNHRSSMEIAGEILIANGEPSQGALSIRDGALVKAKQTISIAPTPNLSNVSNEATVQVAGAAHGHAAELITEQNIEFFEGRGTLTIDAGGQVKARAMTMRSGGELVLSGGELNLTTLDTTGGGTVNLSSGVFYVDTVQGNIDVGRVILSPIKSPGLLKINGNLTTNGTTIRIGIGGTEATAYDRLSVKGTVNLNGQLVVSLFNQFSPEVGDSFEILSALGDVNGTFSRRRLELPALRTGLEWNIVYEGNSVTLVVISRKKWPTDIKRVRS